MSQICIPLPPMDRPRAVDVELTIDGVRHAYRYRVENLLWADFDPMPRVDALKAFLDEHDPEWQLAALGVPTEDEMPVLFRYRPRPMAEKSPSVLQEA